MGLPTPAAQAGSTLAKALEGRRLQFPSPSGTAQPHPLSLSCSAQMWKGTGLPNGLPWHEPQAESSSAKALEKDASNLLRPRIQHYITTLSVFCTVQMQKGNGLPTSLPTPVPLIERSLAKALREWQLTCLAIRYRPA